MASERAGGLHLPAGQSSAAVSSSALSNSNSTGWSGWSADGERNPLLVCVQSGSEACPRAIGSPRSSPPDQVAGQPHPRHFTTRVQSPWSVLPVRLNPLQSVTPSPRAALPWKNSVRSHRLLAPHAGHLSLTNSMKLSGRRPFPSFSQLQFVVLAYVFVVPLLLCPSSSPASIIVHPPAEAPRARKFRFCRIRCDHPRSAVGPSCPQFHYRCLSVPSRSPLPVRVFPLAVDSQILGWSVNPSWQVTKLMLATAPPPLVQVAVPLIRVAHSSPSPRHPSRIPPCPVFPFHSVHPGGIPDLIPAAAPRPTARRSLQPG